jgi:hypothetical protein
LVQDCRDLDASVTPELSTFLTSTFHQQRWVISIIHLVTTVLQSLLRKNVVDT